MKLMFFKSSVKTVPLLLKKNINQQRLRKSYLVTLLVRYYPVKHTSLDST